MFLPCKALLLLVLTLVPLSCSRKEATPDAGVKEPAAKTAANLPPGAMSLSAVLKAVESAGYAPVVAVEFEKDHWEVKAYRNGQLLQLKVGPLSGEILPDPPPSLDKPLSAIVKGLEDQGYGPILDLESTAGETGGDAWEVETYKGDKAVTLSVNPASGQITTK